MDEILSQLAEMAQDAADAAACTPALVAAAHDAYLVDAEAADEWLAICIADDGYYFDPFED